MVAKQLKLLAIVGPTASGKTGLSVSVAKKYNGEIIAVDSRTVYKFLDIGTAKPTKVEQQDITHWGLDLVGPGQTYSAAQFQSYAKQAIKDIQSRGKLPILVGGSGLYVDAILYDYTFAPPNKVQRQQLEQMTIPALQEQINTLGLSLPENLQNKRYLVRTIERGNIKMGQKQLDLGTVVIGLNPSKEVLTERITLRAEQMLKDGVIDEIKRAYELYLEDSEALQGGIYKSFWPFIYGTKSQQEAVKYFVTSDLQLAKKQWTWFKRNNDISWFTDASEAEAWFINQYGGTL